MKKILVFFITIVLTISCFSLTGCGSNNDPDENATTKVIKVWVHKSEAEEEGKVYRAISELFNQEKIKTADGKKTILMKIEFKNSSDTLSTSINAEVLTGGLPDIVAVDAPNVAAYVDSGILQSIDEYVTADTRSSYVDSVIEQGTINNKLYTLSGMDAPAGLYYNKKILPEIGYGTSTKPFGTIENPWTWNDVLRVMLELKAAGKPYKFKSNLGFGGDEGCMYLYSSLIYSAGGSFFGENQKVDGALNSEASLKGLKIFEKLFIENDKYSDSEEIIYNGTNVNAFATGEVAFQIYGPWDVTTINKTYPTFKDKYDIMPFPVYADENNQNKGTIATPCGSWGFGVTNNTKDTASAAIVVEYLTNKVSSKLLYESIGTFPTNKELFEEIDAFKSGAFKSLSDLLIQTGTPRPKMVNYPKLSAAYSDIIEYVGTQTSISGYNLEGFINAKAASVDR
jgi:fructooligosaccharide transport system substrate-binding protein